MSERKLDEDKKGIALMGSRTILTIMLAFSIYTFFNKEPIAAKLLATGGFIGILFLFIMSFISPLTSRS